jgi:hypothetical protein
MGLQLINTGLTANDGSGDTLRSAGAKINSNFTELYAGVQIPAATAGTLGTVRPDGTSIIIDGRGVLSVLTAGSPASTVNLGLVRVDGTTITSNAGLITATPYTLPTATTSVLGGVKVDGTSISINNGTISLTLPRATTTILGGVKVDGTTVTINNSTGVISAASSYSLPTASTTALGGVKVDGSSVTVNGSGVISVSAGLAGSVVFKGGWNATTNTPTLANGSGTSGWMYIVTAAGTQNLGAGSITYAAGDLLVYDGSNWIDVAANNGVVSFNTRTGAVTLTSSDITTALGFTPIQASSLNVATTAASGGGSLSYASGSFTFAPASIPTYTVSTASASGGGSLSLSGSTFTFAPATTYTLPTATPSVLGGVKIDNNSIVINNGVISVGGALTSATIFKGSWDASANSPVLGAGTPANVAAGWQYIVSVAATRDIGNGSAVWSVGDLAIYDGAKWVRIPGGNNVQSFNTRQGAITLTSSDVTTALGFTPSNSIGAGTVTLVSVASANGFTGTVATNTTTPTITLTTSITGLLKGNGTAISAATAGTDYQAAISATGLLKSSGVSGNVSAATAGTDYVSPSSTETLTNKTLGATTISGHLIPSADVTYDLGSASNKFRDLYLSGSTIKLGSATLSSSGTTLAIPALSTLTTPIIATNITTASTSFDLLNTTATTLNIGGAATTALNIGTSSAPITGFAKTATTSSTASSLGYLGLPQSATNTSATLAIGDAGKHIYVNTASQTMTIPANGTVAYPIGTTLTFIAGPSATTVSIAITTDTMYLAGTGTTGTRTLAAHGMATAVKVAATTWYINGSGLT